PQKLVAKLYSHLSLDTFVKPKSYVIERTFVITKSKSGSREKYIGICSQSIPLRKSLKKFFGQSNNFEIITTFMSKLM
ncbi:Protein of unknown function, partial [Cotesia congregata]